MTNSVFEASDVRKKRKDDKKICKKASVLSILEKNHAT